METRKVPVCEGYDATANPRVASFAGQLDDQLRRLKEDVAGLEVRHLEWQVHPGTNTVGMLLAHLAVVDLWWMVLAPQGNLPDAQSDRYMVETIGIEMSGDGLPIPPDGRHPQSLAGKTLEAYLQMMDRARAATHEVMRGWTDADLGTTFTLRERPITREWTAYHVLEHFCGHYGQILMLLHFMRDAGVLPKAAEA